MVGHQWPTVAGHALVAQVHYFAVWDSGGWYRAPLAAVTAVSGPLVARRTIDQGSDVGCVGRPLTV